MATSKNAMRPGGRKRRRQILEAVIRLIAREGIRAIRHRKVAAEAKVPLSATTYYFEGIDDLVREAFKFYAGHELDGEATKRPLALNVRIENLLAEADLQAQSQQKRVQLAGKIVDMLSSYILAQGEDKDNRIVELAFRHESQGDPALKQLIDTEEDNSLSDISRILTTLGVDVDEARADAQIILSMIYRLEYEVAFSNMSADEVRSVIARQMQYIFPAN